MSYPRSSSKLRSECSRPGQLAYQFEAVDEDRAWGAVGDGFDPRGELLFEKCLHAPAVEVVEHTRLLELAGVRVPGGEVLGSVLIDREDSLSTRGNLPSQGSVLHLGCQIDEVPQGSRAPFGLVEDLGAKHRHQRERFVEAVDRRQDVVGLLRSKLGGSASGSGPL